MIQVAIPIDIGTIISTKSGAFSLATPLRVDRLLSLAINAALGSRAPQDKRERSVRTALDGLREGRFVIDVDGRLYDRPDAVVVCAGVVTLRFFSTEPHGRRVKAH